MKNISIFVALLLFVACVPSPKAVSVIPEPLHCTVSEGSFTLNPKDKIACPEELNSVAEYMVQAIKASVGLDLTVAPAGEQGAITLSLGLENPNPEAYTLTINGDGIHIQGSTVRGVIMAVATLEQLLENDSSKAAVLAYVQIEDEPRFEYRGMHLDVSRHFYTTEQVKGFLDLMARYKLNKFHWHLTDDQGWRIEIKKYPLLTEKGAWRQLNWQDRQCQSYQKELDDPDFELPAEFMKISDGDTLYGGFYTQQQIREVVAYAAQRGIDVLPELDMPGHLMAALTGYPELSCKGQARWGASFSDPLCLGKEVSLQMAKDIYTEVAELFPYEYMHLGADEVEWTSWKACPYCQRRIVSEKLTGVEQLQSWFVHQMERHFNSLGKKLIGWDEILAGGLSPTATIMWWRDWAPEAVPTATAAGNKAIISPCFSMYLDAWESKGSLEGTYNYEPVGKNLSEAQAANIMGVQGNLWCETIPTVRRAQHQLFPRLLAIAETGWSAPTLKNWEKFQQKFITEVDYLDMHHVNYRLPDLTGFSDVNVFMDSMFVEVESILPNITIRYTTDGTMPTTTSTKYEGKFPITSSAKYRFRGFRPDSTSGEVYTAEYRKEVCAPAIEPLPTKASMTQYEYKGRKCADITTAPKVKQWALDSVALPAGLKGWLGLIYQGMFEVPQDGIYSFSLKSNDGSMLYVDGAELINNDGPHGDKVMVVQKALAKGLHSVRGEFFDMNNGGCFQVKIKGEGDADFKILKIK
ncbi:MAG: family 20 glycosylhydrolase [Mucinivorans sp.]